MLAPFGERLIAYLIDALLLGAVSLVYTIPLVIYVVSQAVALSGPDGTIESE